MISKTCHKNFINLVKCRYFCFQMAHRVAGWKSMSSCCKLAKITVKLRCFWMPMANFHSNFREFEALGDVFFGHQRCIKYLKAKFCHRSLKNETLHLDTYNGFLQEFSLIWLKKQSSSIDFFSISRVLYFICSPKKEGLRRLYLFSN